MPPLHPAQAVASNDPFLAARLKEKKVAREFQRRRHNDWNEIYELYRNQPRLNRLTQRQSVNIPLMKETVKTLLSKVDETPDINWQELGGDEGKEIIFQEMWNSDFALEDYEGVDIQDKKSVLMYGRSFKKLNLNPPKDRADKGLITVNALDIYDVIVDPLTNPLKLETARFVIHQNIFRSLNDVLNDPRYTNEGKKKLRIFKTTEDAVIISGSNQEEYERKMERQKAMGLHTRAFSGHYFEFSAGEVIVNMTEHISNIWNPGKKKFEKQVIVYADDMVEMMRMPLKQAIGIDSYPYVTWTEDIETADYWPDGPADLVKTPNKVVNVWFSQLVENRTLRNFQMHWYDQTAGNYTAQTYEPGPGKMLPAPGNPKDVIMPVDIQGLDETLTAIDFLSRIIERGSGATAIEKGTGEKKRTTLGEVEILVGKALERTNAMSKFYQRAWYDFSIKWYEMMSANQKTPRKLFRLSHKGKLWPKTVTPKDWKTETGYRPVVASSSEHEAEQTKGIQKWDFVIQRNPTNKALRSIGLKRQLEMLKLNPEELRQIQEGEKDAEDATQQAIAQEQAQEGQSTGLQNVQQGINELNNLQNA